MIKLNLQRTLSTYQLIYDLKISFIDEEVNK